MHYRWLPLLLLICGCASQRPLIDSVLDADTGITHWQPARPLVFDHQQPELAATGADHVLVAPVAVSRQGTRRQYLWVGVASSIDRGLSGADRPVVDAYMLMVDDQPMVLDVHPWADISRVTPFSSSVPVAAAYGARISDSQLDRLSAADQVSITLTGSNKRVMNYSNRDIDARRALFSAAVSKNP